MERTARLITLTDRISKEEVAGFAIGMVMGMAGTWDFSPLGPASACAGRMLGRRWGPALGAAVGAAIFKRWTGLCHTAVFLGMSVMWESFRRPRKRHYTAMLVCSAILCAPFFYIESLYDGMCGLAQLSAALVFNSAFVKAGRAISRARLGRVLGERDMTALFITLGGLCAGASCIEVSGVTPGGMIAAFAAVFLCCTSGAYAVAAAAVAGTGLVLSGGDIAVVGAMVIAALGACRLENRLYVGGVFFMAATFCCYYGNCGTAPILEIGAGTAACLVLPSEWIQRVAYCLNAEEETQRRLAGMEARVRGAAEVMDRVSALLEQCPESRAEMFAGRQLKCVSEAINAIPESTEQSGRYTMECGGASCPKQGSKEAGDSMAARELDGGKLMMLSDGMGSGTSARWESRAAVSLIGDLMSIGVKEMDALDCVNRLLICKGEYDMYATLDVMTFDCKSGRASFLKLGAPPTYILRNGDVTELRAETLPIGIVEPIRPARKEMMLLPGDAVIMVTDGITDTLGEGIISAIAAMGQGEPREMAKALLMCAMKRSRADDMSVLVGVVR